MDCPPCLLLLLPPIGVGSRKQLQGLLPGSSGRQMGSRKQLPPLDQEINFYQPFERGAGCMSNYAYRVKNGQIRETYVISSLSRILTVSATRIVEHLACAGACPPQPPTVDLGYRAVDLGHRAETQALRWSAPSHGCDPQAASATSFGWGHRFHHDLDLSRYIHFPLPTFCIIQFRSRSSLDSISSRRCP
jgi:hypothetical protein